MLIMFLCFISYVTVGFCIKPRPPLELSVRQTSMPRGQTKIILHALANMESESVELNMELSKDIATIHGSTQWKGQIKKGEIQTIEVIIQDIPNLQQKVIGKATIAQGGQTFHQQARLLMNELERPPRVPFSKQKEAGETILEFRGN